MKSIIYVCVAFSLLYFGISVATEIESTEQYETCSNYYFLLSVAGPGLVNDLTQKQAGQAYWALLKKVSPDPESMSRDAQLLAAEKTQKMRNEISGPYTQENIRIFREKYDGLCKPLLKRAWCDAYKILDSSACAE